MKIASRTLHGLKILAYVAKTTRSGRVVPGRKIALQQSINEPYLEQIMLALKKGGLVQTVRGRHGGYRLAREPAAITVLDVIEIFEGVIQFVDHGDDGASGSAVPEHAVIDTVWSELAHGFRDAAAQITLASIVDRCRSIEPDYVI